MSPFESLMEEQLVDVLRFFDTLCPVAEQVIDVPKISFEDIPARRLCREPQLVEQLVEVPTILYFLKQKVEQNRTEQNRTEQNTTEHNRTQQNTTEHNRTQQNTTTTQHYNNTP